MISIIIPFGLSLERDFITKRVIFLAKFFGEILSTDGALKGEFEIIFVEGFSSVENSSVQAEILKNNHAYFKDIAQQNLGRFSLASCRNLGALNAKGEAILFLDADCFLGENSLKKVAQIAKIRNIFANENAFLMLPCLYLSKNGTEILRSLPKNEWEIRAVNDLMSSGREFVQNFALASSIFCLNRQKFLKIGANSENFSGHGYEDFEFLLRFLRDSCRFERLPSQLDFDSRGWDFCDFKGFRALFSLLGFEGAFFGIYALHFWHENPNQNGYLDFKEQNHKYFYDKLDEFSREFLPQNSPEIFAKNPQNFRIFSLNSINYLPYNFELKNSRPNFAPKIPAKFSHTKFYRLFAKFRRDKRAFFGDSKSPFLRYFSRFFKVKPSQKKLLPFVFSGCVKIPALNFAKKFRPKKQRANAKYICDFAL